VKDMALLTASAHLRSVCREGSCSADDLIRFGEKVDWQEDVLRIAKSYAHQMLLYHTEFCNNYKQLLKDL
jgi:hypothetical protein